MTFFQNIAFDLDDTLLDTSGCLIPAASRRALNYIASKILEGASSTERDVQVETMLRKRNEILRTDPRANPWLILANGNVEIAETARQVFLKSPLENLADDQIRPTPGALNLLEWARSRSELHLVTSGDPTVQNRKIDALEIRSYFKSIQIVEAHPSPANGKGPKHFAFQNIFNAYPGSTGTSFLSVGNRVDTDLGEAKLLNWRTVWIRFGEHASLSPKRPSEIPDFEVATPSDLLAIWSQQFPNPISEPAKS